ncbi:acetyltransferase, GNAT family [Lachnospiraceae bacterium TWA4]|nr:acetyltransferase, GNAT family [Lachnospiraceae bacterium TWA4]
MEIKSLTKLNRKQIIRVNELLTQCRQHEPVTIAPTMTSDSNYDPTIPCLYLLEESGFLMSYLSIYMPNPYYAECVAYTFPAARKRGNFMKLWMQALGELHDHPNVNLDEMEIMFLTDGKSPDALATLKALRMKYQYTEYVLTKKLMSEPPLPPTDLSFNLLDAKSDGDANAIYMLHESMFAEGEAASRVFVESCKQDYVQNYLVRAAEEDNRPVGMFHLALDGDRVFLFGFGVLPDYQGKGYAQKMINLALSEVPDGILTMGLQVSSYNEAAYNLYIKAGFSESSRLDYYYDDFETDF